MNMEGNARVEISVSMMEFRKWMKGDNQLWPILGADILFIEDRLRERPGYNEQLSLGENIKNMVGEYALKELDKFSERASRNLHGR